MTAGNMTSVSRYPTESEYSVIKYMADKAHYEWHECDNGMRVAEMQDGMGSLLLIPAKQTTKDRTFKAQISDALFKDVDGIDVIVSLNIDQDGFLYELDVWKMNYGRIIDYSNLVNRTFP